MAALTYLSLGWGVQPRMSASKTKRRAAARKLAQAVALDVRKKDLQGPGLPKHWRSIRLGA